MINPKELRIGNIIYCITNKLNVVVQWPHPAQVVINVQWPDGGGCEHVHADLEECVPIPLTSEWLGRCGFTKQGDGSFYIQVGNTLYLEFDNDLSCSIIPETWSGSAVYTFADISHLHQLQNLYFALTGEELTIKN